MITRILNHKSKGLSRAALILSITTFLSHLLGLFRDRLLAGTFGASGELDVYFTAFRIPSLIQAVLIAGGVGAVMIPLFSKEMKRSKKEAMRYMNSLLNLSFLSLIVLCSILFVLTPWLSKVLYPGFNAAQQGDLVLLTRIIFLSPILLGLSFIFSGFIQYFDRFLAYGLAALLYNVGIILGISVFVPRFGLVGLAYGVVLGAFMHLLVQVPSAISEGFEFKPLFTIDRRIKETVVLMIPTALTALFIQIGMIVVVALASSLFEGSIAVLNLVTRLKDVPVSLLGTSFAIAAFATLSKRWSDDNRKRFWKELSSVLRQVTFLIIPTSLILFVLRAQVIRIIFHTGSWSWEDTRIAAATLGVFTFFMVFESMVVVLRKALYAMQEMRYATITEAARLIVMTLSVLFVLYMFNSVSEFSLFFTEALKIKNVSKVSILAFPIGIGLGSVVQSSMLFLYLIRKGMKKEKEIVSSLFRISVTSVASALFAWIALRPLSSFMSLTSLVDLLIQVVLSSSSGFLLYLLLSYVLSFPEMELLVEKFSQKRRDNI